MGISQDLSYFGITNYNSFDTTNQNTNINKNMLKTQFQMNTSSNNAFQQSPPQINKSKNYFFSNSSQANNHQNPLSNYQQQMQQNQVEQQLTRLLIKDQQIKQNMSIIKTKKKSMENWRVLKGDSIREQMEFILGDRESMIPKIMHVSKIQSQIKDSKESNKSNFKKNRLQTKSPKTEQVKEIVEQKFQSLTKQEINIQDQEVSDIQTTRQDDYKLREPQILQSLFNASISSQFMDDQMKKYQMMPEQSQHQLKVQQEAQEVILSQQQCYLNANSNQLSQYQTPTNHMKIDIQSKSQQKDLHNDSLDFNIQGVSVPSQFDRTKQDYQQELLRKVTMLKQISYQQQQQQNNFRATAHSSLIQHQNSNNSSHLVNQKYQILNKTMAQGFKDIKMPPRTLLFDKQNLDMLKQFEGADTQQQNQSVHLSKDSPHKPKDVIIIEGVGKDFIMNSNRSGEEIQQQIFKNQAHQTYSQIDQAYNKYKSLELKQFIQSKLNQSQLGFYQIQPCSKSPNRDIQRELDVGHQIPTQQPQILINEEQEPVEIKKIF
eukprot:403375213